MTIMKKRMSEMNKRLLEKDFVSQKLKGVNETILENNLTEEAKARLDDLKKAKPEFGKKVEAAIIKAAHGGELKTRIDDYKMKLILQKATTGDFTI